MPQEMVSTPFGEINAIVEGKLDSDNTLLLLHGNSSTWRAFTPVLDSEEFKSTYRIIALDFPGHGESSDAPNPELSYNIPAYGKAAIEVLRHFQVKSYVAFGSSMGGHAAWSMIKVLESSGDILVRGVMTAGSIPFGNIEEAKEGFKLDMNDNVASTEVMTDDQIEHIVKGAYGGTPEPFMYESIKRTDKAARPLMFQNIVNGGMTDERKLVKETKVPLAVVNGENDVFINLDLFDKLEFGSLWKGKCITIMGASHCPYWDNPGTFLPILTEFAADCYA